MSLGGAVARPRRTRSGAMVPSWSASAWCAAALVAVFVLLTLWWLTQDHAVPYGDAAEELWAAFRFRDYTLHADVGAIFDYPAYYPPYGLLLGGLIAIVGGVGRNAVVLGANLVCVPLLALACYRVGRRVAGATAGALAVAFALGAPLLIEQLHVFIIDTFEATMVAVSVWLILASERFSRVGVAALAGLAIGIGTGTKEQFPLYVTGLIVVVLARGGWRNMRGLALFAGLALLLGAPWYVHKHDVLGKIYSASRTGEGLLFPVPPLARPPLLSAANVEWYGWATLNGLLFAPLALFAFVGVAVALARLRRPEVRASVVPELLGGLGGAWLLLTILTHKDMRYALPMIVYLAVLGTAWIALLPRAWRTVAGGGLAAAVVATTLGMTFGVGGPIPERLPGNLGAALGVGVPPRDRVVVYANHDYLVSGPRRDGDVLALLRGLHRAGVRTIYWDPAVAGPEHGDFNGAGLSVLGRMAGISVASRIAFGVILPGYALLMYQPAPPGTRPCVRFDSGMGVWALLPHAGGGAVSYCPGRGTTGTPIPVPAISQQAGATNLP
ncbi:MAG: glycosyltransferase family 39 protein [Actinobacteria bacterium]|nr:glycosyltransferase family 39 protein [Actinomycetota bacterium]